MNIIALTLVVVCVLASIGVAAWTWQVVNDNGDEFSELAGFQGPRFDD
jgi:peptidoglycan/LPS O-acetylase OafA/YrhL